MEARHPDNTKTVTSALSLLLIEDNPSDVRLIRDTLGAATTARFDVLSADCLTAGLQQLAQGGIDAVLLDLALPDSDGLSTFRKVCAQAPDTPIIVLTGLGDTITALNAIKEGAQDYLVKGRVDIDSLERAVRYAIERKSGEVALQRQTRVLHSILNSIADGVVVVDENGQCQLYNPAAEEKLGFCPAEAPHYEWPERFGFFLPDGAASHPVDQLPLSRARRGEVVKEHELFLRPAATPEGVLLSVNATPLKDETGRVRGGVAVFRDITRQRRADEQIRKLNAELEQRVAERTRELEAFSYSVSHDLRGPLRSVDGFSLELLDECGDKLDDRGMEYLRRVREAAQRMGRLIDALLTLSRVSRLEICREPVNLSALARAIVSELRTREPDRQVQAVISDGLMTSGDSPLMRIVLENLIGNAWKFTAAKNSRAKIEVGAIKRSNEPIYFVRDNGAGFDMAYAEKLFDPFERLHKETEFEGLGIGLATVCRIIQRHEGRIWAEGAVGRGATFHFTNRRA
jgi:PAS domain S-box-containing protein